MSDQMRVIVQAVGVTVEHQDLEAAISMIRASHENGFPCAIEVCW